MKLFSKWVKQTWKHFRFAIGLTLALTITILVLLVIVLAQQSLWLTKSTADIALQDQQLQINFQIDQAEKAGFEAFSANLGTDNRWLDGMTITLDQQAADQLEAYLPRQVKIKASDRILVFNQSGLPSLSKTQLSSALPSQDGQLSLYQQDGTWYLVIKDLASVVTQATSSGQLKLAAGTFEQFWPVLSKFATIRTEIGPQTLRGAILLK